MEVDKDTGLPPEYFLLTLSLLQNTELFDN